MRLQVPACVHCSRYLFNMFFGECYSGHGPTSAGFGVEWRHFQPQMALRTIPPGEMVVSQARPTYPSVHMQPSFCSQVSEC